jgi:dTDP-4-dehydrorhamnose reductase
MLTAPAMPAGSGDFGMLVGLTSRELDVRDAARVDQAIREIRPGCVVNLAGYTAVDKAEKEPAVAFAVNVDGAANVARACAFISAPLLHLSTDYVFDGLKGAPYVETDICRPVGAYARSKLAGEEAVREAARCHVILRTAWLFGIHGTNFVKTILRLALVRDELAVVDDQAGSPTPTNALARALQIIAAQCAGGSCPWGTYHFAGAPAASRYELACAIVGSARHLLNRNVAVRPIPSEAYPTPAARPPDSSLDSGKIGRTFGLSAPDWRAEVSRTVAALLEADAAKVSQ